eukprot:Phypoly_transcript_12523.p1 GENE.Phypoly_transcript_12523~~Phypoly_transcript_12523.p1  ORF type:complete len:258 (+),score=44.09 Phypoly_transcript_12523:347-1120(+)
MNTSQLAVGKGVVPQESVPAKLEGWRLAFNLRSVLKAMGSMANVVPDPKSVVHGTLHKVTKEQLKQIDNFEAEGHIYKRILVPVTKYTGEKVEANVYTALPDYVVGEAQPSLRYKNILLSGARAANIDEEYCDFLEKVVHYPFEHDKNRVKPIIPEKNFTREELKENNSIIGFMGVVFDISHLSPIMQNLLRRFGTPEYAFLRFMPCTPPAKPPPIPDKFSDFTPEQLEFLDGMLHAMELEWPIVGRCPLPTTRDFV